ncbi:MAG TPA: YvcK family protein [Tissierellia bacterium]|nr:YvcK family protein [Tissierellia bacterium]
MDKRIVIIGGGTGLSSLLRGLKHVTKDLHAVVNVVDDGGSSGLLRKDMDVIPPGDIRNCILAMSNAPPTMERLFNYRFGKGSLEGQSFGNLMLAALEDICGSIEASIQETSQVFNITGKVYPVTLSNIRLQAELTNGRRVIGESLIPQEAIRQHSPIKTVNLLPARPKTLPEVIAVIETADIVLVGPGSLYTSLLPALLVSGIKEAIIRSTGKCFYVANLMTQPGETDGLKLSDHIRVIEEHIEDPIFDGVIVNNAMPKPEVLQEYASQSARPIVIEDDEWDYFQDKQLAIKQGGYIVLKDGLIRHHHQLVARDILDFAEELSLK